MGLIPFLSKNRFDLIYELYISADESAVNCSRLALFLLDLPRGFAFGRELSGCRHLLRSLI